MSSYQDDYISLFNSLVTEATKAGSPYAQTLDFVQDEVNNFNITEKEKAEIIANLMAQVTVGITQSAMNNANQVKLGESQAGLTTAQANLVGAQKTTEEARQLLLSAQKTLTANQSASETSKQASMAAQTTLYQKDAAYKAQQTSSLEQSVVDNRKIKGLEIYSDFISMIVGGGGYKVPQLMLIAFLNSTYGLMGLDDGTGDAAAYVPVDSEFTTDNASASPPETA